jgi:hypothetical protein
VLKNAKPVIARRPQADAAIPKPMDLRGLRIATAALRPRDDITQTFNSLLVDSV